MAKSRWRRTWVKMYVNECLEGSIRFDFTPAERSIWYDLVLMAGRCRNPGIISANEKAPYPHKYIAGMLNVDVELLESTLAKCKVSGRIVENDSGIELVNWEHYQSEYQRQKPYREKKTEGKKKVKEFKNGSNKQDFGGLCTLYEQEIGKLTQTVGEELNILYEDYGSQVLKDAIKEAAVYNKKNLRYIQKILETWEGKGKAHQKGRDAPAWMLEGIDGKEHT